MPRILSILVLLLFSLPAFPWGAVGHRVVGEVAEAHLSKKAKKAVRKLLGKETLATAAVWADEIRSHQAKSAEVARRWSPIPVNKMDPKQQAGVISRWHYVSINDDETYKTSTKNKSGDIVWAMKRMESALRDPKSELLARKEALKLIAHYIGDIHQPLHAGMAWDRGGNNCWLNWMPEKYPKNITPAPPLENNNFKKLHSIWDSEIINFHHLSYQEYAQKINRADAKILSELDPAREKELEKLSAKKLRKIFQSKKQAWISSSYEQWTAESQSLRNLAYVGKKPVGGHRPYCFDSFKTSLDRAVIPKFSWTEITQATEVINYRLLQAGIRLAAVLNKVFSK